MYAFACHFITDHGGDDSDLPHHDHDYIAQGLPFPHQISAGVVGDIGRGRLSRLDAMSIGTFGAGAVQARWRRVVPARRHGHALPARRPVHRPHRQSIEQQRPLFGYTRTALPFSTALGQRRSTTPSAARSTFLSTAGPPVFLTLSAVSATGVRNIRTLCEVPTRHEFPTLTELGRRFTLVPSRGWVVR